MLLPGFPPQEPPHCSACSCSSPPRTRRGRSASSGRCLRFGREFAATRLKWHTNKDTPIPSLTRLPPEPDPRIDIYDSEADAIDGASPRPATWPAGAVGPGAPVRFGTVARRKESWLGRAMDMDEAWAAWDKAVGCAAFRTKHADLIAQYQNDTWPQSSSFQDASSLPCSALKLPHVAIQIFQTTRAAQGREAGPLVVQMDMEGHGAGKGRPGHSADGRRISPVQLARAHWSTDERMAHSIGSRSNNMKEEEADVLDTYSMCHAQHWQLHQQQHAGGREAPTACANISGHMVRGRTWMAGTRATRRAKVGARARARVSLQPAAADREGGGREHREERQEGMGEEEEEEEEEVVVMTSGGKGGSRGGSAGS
ncbi:unnamed protein product [Closterium sp. Naga37s-1]|nr:unnamed protein product [Closterium sp. Naga37s-1]